MQAFNLNEMAERLSSYDAPHVEVAGQRVSSIRVFETARTQSELWRLTPGQHIPPHQHSGIDDVFFCIRGEGTVRTWDADGRVVEHALLPGSVILVEPNTPHEVSCSADDLCYVLLQAPKELYDVAEYKTESE